MIKDSGIHQVPIIAEGRKTIDELKQLVNSKSNFYDGLREGIYVRVYENGYLKQRGKIVRTDFICGDEHWAKNEYIINGLAKN